MSLFASIDGTIFPAAEARVSVFDNGFTFGDSVYETLRTYDHRPLRLGAHLARLRRSAERIGITIPVDDGELRRRFQALEAHAGHPNAFVRFVVSRGVGDVSYHFDRVKGPTIVVIMKPFEGYAPQQYTEGLTLAIVSVRRNHPQALDPAIKSCNLLNNILAVREAQGKGASEAIMLNQAGAVVECASSNIFLVRKGTVVTPPLRDGLLAGVTRDIVIEIGREIGLDVREETIRPEELFAADEVFITSSLKEAAPVRAIDGRAIGSGRPGPVTRKIEQAFLAALPRLLD
jgi:branched-chain amino acid aminotransferase